MTGITENRKVTGTNSGITKQPVNFPHSINSSLQHIPLQTCLWSVPNYLTILTLLSETSSSHNKEGKVSSALLYSLFSLKSVI